MKLILLLVTLLTAVINSLGYSRYGDNGCKGFINDASSLEDDSDYQVDGSGSNNYAIGDDFRLKVHVINDWELRVSWNASKYESLAPLYGWNYKVLVTVNTTYQTSFGNRSFTTSSEVDTKKNHETFPLYNPFATYTITVLAATRSQQCLGERIVVSDLPGREDAIRHFQIRLRFYTFWDCERKLKKKHRVLAQFNREIFEALREHQNRYGISLNISLNLSQYKLTDLNVICQKDREAIFTGRIIAIGNASNNTEFIKTMQSWVRTQPTLPIRKDVVVVDKNCPVYYVPASGEYCVEPEVDEKVNETREPTVTSSNSGGLSGVVIAVIVVAIVLLVILLGLTIAVYYCSSRHKIFTRIANFSFRSQSTISRQLRINNVLADVESVGSSSYRSRDNSALNQTSSHHCCKGT